MANRLITIDELRAEIIALANKESVNSGLSAQEESRLIYDACVSIGNSSMEMGEVKSLGAE